MDDLLYCPSGHPYLWLESTTTMAMPLELLQPPPMDPSSCPTSDQPGSEVHVWVGHHKPRVFR